MCKIATRHHDLDYEPEVVHDFVYLGSSSSDSICVDTEHAELNGRIGKAATTMFSLAKWYGLTISSQNTSRSWPKKLISVISTLLHASESWALYFRQEMRLSASHMLSYFSITWKGEIPNYTIIKSIILVGLAGRWSRDAKRDRVR